MGMYKKQNFNWEVIFQTSLGKEFIIENNLDEKSALRCRDDHLLDLHPDAALIVREMRTPKVHLNAFDCVKVFSTSAQSDK